MKYLLASLLTLSALLQASDNAPKIPGILIYTTLSVSTPYIIDAPEAFKLRKQAKKHDFNSSNKSIQSLQTALVNSNNIATDEWNLACRNLNELKLKEKAIKNHLSLRECFKSAQKQSSPLKMGLKALGVGGFLMCMYKQAQG